MAGMGIAAATAITPMPAQRRLADWRWAQLSSPAIAGLTPTAFASAIEPAIHEHPPTAAVSTSGPVGFMLDDLASAGGRLFHVR
jgi:hypothetical protein